MLMRRIMAEFDIPKTLKNVIERVASASNNRSEELKCFCSQPRLVAVSKTKPKELIMAAYKCGQVYFGENYVQELVDKAHDEQILKECPDIKWHLIGHLQSNKVNKILAAPNIYAIETIDSEKLAAAINKTWGSMNKEYPLRVFVQVNTSQEANKSGVPPEKASEVVKYILSSCPNLKFIGLMTIGAYDHDMTLGPNPDFQALIKCRMNVCVDLGLDPSDVELSMGMSSDFEHAIQVGSTNVRVGSTIFGTREYTH